jgi:putative membrane protein
MDTIIISIVRRPYVFAFLCAYFILAIKRWGAMRSLLWLVAGFVIAWMSEYASINLSFPYGEYHYVYENLKGELLLGGVPVFDSISYAFLIFAGFTTAEFIARRSSMIIRVFLGAGLTMLLDVIIDPIATMGDKWFLGKIHYYAYSGFYFGVPLSNFAGWFIVSLAVILFNVRMWSHYPVFFGNRPFDIIAGGPSNKDETFNISYPLFFIAIALFNIVITFRVGEIVLGISSSTILLLISVFVMLAFRSGIPRQRTGS